MTKYHLNLAHLYGNLLNTYSDVGNIITLRYYATLTLQFRLSVLVKSLIQQSLTLPFVEAVKTTNNSLFQRICQIRRPGLNNLLMIKNHYLQSVVATNYWANIILVPMEKKFRD